jgi:hypothetical protein
LLIAAILGVCRAAWGRRKTGILSSIYAVVLGSVIGTQAGYLFVREMRFLLCFDYLVPGLLLSSKFLGAALSLRFFYSRTLIGPEPSWSLIFRGRPFINSVATVCIAALIVCYIWIRNDFEGNWTIMNDYLRLYNVYLGFFGGSALCPMVFLAIWRNRDALCDELACKCANVAKLF